MTTPLLNLILRCQCHLTPRGVYPPVVCNEAGSPIQILVYTLIVQMKPTQDRDSVLEKCLHYDNLSLSQYDVGVSLHSNTHTLFMYVVH